MTNTTVIKFRSMTASESKAIKDDLKAQGLKFRVQLKNGRVYLYNGENTMTKEQKAIVRDTLVLLDYVDCKGESFSLPAFATESWRIYNGMPVCALA